MRLEQKATFFSISVALLLTIMKIVIWIASWSVAVLSSAIDSLLDFFVSTFNFFAIKNSNKEIDELFNYWRWKIEALASFLEGLIISFSWLFILYKSVLRLINWEQISEIYSSIIVMVISVIVTWFLVRYLSIIQKKTNSIVIKADKLHYKTDLYTNVWILFSLVVIYFTDLYFIDSVIWILISIYIIYSAYNIVKEWFLLLLDIALPEDIVSKIKVLLTSSDKTVISYHCLKTRSSWNHNFVSAHLVFNKDIKLIDAHEKCDLIESKIKEIDNSREWTINIHLDPVDDSIECPIECNWK